MPFNYQYSIITSYAGLAKNAAGRADEAVEIRIVFSAGPTTRLNLNLYLRPGRRPGFEFYYIIGRAEKPVLDLTMLSAVPTTRLNF